MPGGKTSLMTAGVRMSTRGNTADNNFGDKKNGGASTIGNIITTNKVLSARRHPFMFDVRGGTIVGGVGKIQTMAAMMSDGVNTNITYP